MTNLMENGKNNDHHRRNYRHHRFNYSFYPFQFKLVRSTSGRCTHRERKFGILFTDHNHDCPIHNSFIDFVDHSEN